MSKLKEEAQRIRKEVQQRTMSYIVAALGFVAGLAWNDAIKSLIEYLFPLSQNSVRIKLIYAILITTIVVLISLYTVKLLDEEKEK